MSPEDEALSRIVLYVGLGIGLLCVAAALAIQVWMLRKGKATRKDLRDLVMGLLFVAFLLALTMLMQSGKHPGKPPIAVQAVVAAVFTSIYVLVLPGLIDGGMAAVGALIRHDRLRGAMRLAAAAMGMTMMAGAIINILPASWVLRAIALFTGSVAGLIARCVQLSRANRPEPPESESLIIKASS